MQADNAAALKALDRAKAQLFYQKNAGFIAGLMTRHEIILSDKNTTAWVSATHMGFNPDFMMNLPEASRVTVIAHEIWHPALLHMVRRGDRCPDLWNQAGDHVINLNLEEDGYSFVGLEFALKDPRFKGMSTDEVYDILAEEAADGKPQPDTADGLMQGDIIYIDQSEEGDDGSAGEMTSEEIEAATRDLVSKVHGAQMQAAMSKMPGNIPGEISLFIDRFLRPKLPWKRLLRRFFTAISDAERSFSKINRRYSHGSVIMPGLAGNEGLESINYYLDVSGSVTDEDVIRFNSEVAAIKKDFRPELLRVVTFDRKIRDVFTYEKDEPFTKLEIVGRGGTNLEEVFEDLNKTRPPAAVIFTDLYVDIPEKPPKVPIIWICVGNPDQKVPYGQIIHLENE